MKQNLRSIFLLLALASSVFAKVNSTVLPFPFSLPDQKTAAPTSEYEWNGACMQFLKPTKVTDTHFFMGHCVGGTGLQCQSWRDALVHQYSKTMPLKTVKQEWCTTVFNEVAGGQRAEQDKTSTSKPTSEGSKSRAEPPNPTTTTSTTTSTAEPQASATADSSKFLAAQPARGANASLSYKLEVRGQNCGLQAKETYVSTTDDVETCKSKCSADSLCLAYTTYVSHTCELKCLHYSHPCDAKHRASTKCKGDIESFSKVYNSVSSTAPPKTETKLRSKPASKAPAKASQTTPTKTATKATPAIGTDTKKSQPSAKPVKLVVDKKPVPAAKPVKAVKAVKSQDLKEDTVLPTAETAVKDVRSTKHHLSWKDLLPKSAAASSTNSSKKDCACVHRHGKEVCHCLGEKDNAASASVIKSHGTPKLNGKFKAEQYASSKQNAK